jgi:ATP-dependent RNA helicase DDX47/RRP3
MPPVKKRKVAQEVASPAEDSDSQSSRSESPAAENTTNDDGSAENTSTPKTFKQLGVIDSLVEACETLGYKAPTPIVSIYTRNQRDGLRRV